MKILIIPVNFNSYKELKSYLTSIDKAISIMNDIQVEVYIADNSTYKESVDFSIYSHIKLEYKHFENIGYLGAAQEVIKLKRDMNIYDYVVISNVDIQMSEDFFLRLSEQCFDVDVAWIAPQIYSNDENRDRNPKVINRYSKKKLSILYYMYKYPILFYLYTFTAYKRKKLQPKYAEMDIYAGHGSFIMLTRNYFDTYNEICYPIFLFGEELFLAEEIRMAGKKVHYVPSLVIYDKEHVSTSTLKKKSYFKYNQDSIKYILARYYNE